MKRQAFSLISLFSLLLVAGLANAQTIHLRANVPFNFTAGSKTFSAGTYEIANLSDRDATTLRLLALDDRSSMILTSNAAETLKPADITKLVFDKCGDQYFLAEIWREGSTYGNQLPKTSREKELSKEMARDHADRRVEIVASLY